MAALAIALDMVASPVISEIGIGQTGDDLHFALQAILAHLPPVHSQGFWRRSSGATSANK